MPQEQCIEFLTSYDVFLCGFLYFIFYKVICSLFSKRFFGNALGSNFSSSLQFYMFLPQCKGNKLFSHFCEKIRCRSWLKYAISKNIQKTASLECTDIDAKDEFALLGLGIEEKLRQQRNWCCYHFSVDSIRSLPSGIFIENDFQIFAFLKVLLQTLSSTWNIYEPKEGFFYFSQYFSWQKKI